MEEDLGRPRCILETKRVDRRPEKSAESSDFWAQREEKLGFWGLVVVVVARDFGALREECEGKGKGKGRGFVIETLWLVVALVEAVVVLAQ
jgi:hypothetical protein